MLGFCVCQLLDTMYCFFAETCCLPSKTEKTTLINAKKKIDEVKQDQSDSSDAIISSEEIKQISFDSNSSDVTNSANESEAKEIITDDITLNNSEDLDLIPCDNETIMNLNTSIQEKPDDLEKNDELFEENDVLMQFKNTDNLIENDIVQITNLVSVELIDDIEQNSNESSKDEEEMPEKENTIVENNIVAEVNKIDKLPEIMDDDNIHDEELDHEVDEEEIQGNSDKFNETETNDTVGLHLKNYLTTIN